MPSIGQPVLYQGSAGRFHWAQIAGNINGNTVDLNVFSDGSTWENTNALADNVAYMRYAVDMGTGVGEWQVNTAGLGPTGPTGSTGATGATGAQGPQGDPGDGFGTITLNTPSRVIGTAFQPSSTRPVFVDYSVRVSSSLSLAGGQAGRIELRSDSSDPPTTVRARVAGGSTGTVVIGVSMTDIVEAQMKYLVPAGHFVLLQSVNETGTPTYSITSQTEEVL